MFTWLLYNTLCALPLAALALVVRRLPRATPAFEHLLWLLVVVRLVMPPLPAFEPAGGAASPQFVSSAAPGLGDEVVAWATRTFGNNWSNEGKLGLLVGFVALLLFLIGRELWRVRTVDRRIRATGSAPGRLVQHVQDVAARLGVRAPRVRVLPSSASPFIWSLRGPVLVLPADRELPDETVLAHELAHLLRFDHWTAWLELFAGALHFWNPLFWLARRRLRLASELACDAWVVERFPEERRSYAAALIDAVEKSSSAELVPRAVHAVGVDRRGFEERLRHIMSYRDGLPVPRVALLGVLALAFASLPGVGAPSLERFRAALPELPAGLDRETWLGLRERSLARIAADAADGEAYGGLGLAQLGLGHFEAAAEAYRRQLELGFEPGKAHYNLACVHARAGDPERAVEHLEHAQAIGFPAFEYARMDPDLESLREHPALTSTSE